MDFPACPVFEKNVEKAYRSVERAPRAAWRLATAIENLDDRWFSMLGALLGSASSSVFWYSYFEPLSSWGYAVFFVLVCALSAGVGAFIANVFKCLAWSFSEVNTASPGTLENVLTKVAGDPRLEAVVQRWIEQTKTSPLRASGRRGALGQGHRTSGGIEKSRRTSAGRLARRGSSIELREPLPRQCPPGNAFSPIAQP